MPAALRHHGTPSGLVVLPVTTIRRAMEPMVAIFGIVATMVDKGRQVLITNASYAIPMQAAPTMVLAIRLLIHYCMEMGHITFNRHLAHPVLAAIDLMDN